VSTPVVDLVQRVVLGESLVNLASRRRQEDHINTVGATATGSAFNIHVTLPVKGEAVAAVGDGALDESAGVIGLLNVAVNELLSVLEDGRKVIVLRSVSIV
jgi:hypothetical protein